MRARRCCAANTDDYPGRSMRTCAKKCIGDEPLITHRPADDLAPELDKYREEIKEYMEQEEDVLSYALFPPVALKFFEFRRAQKYGVDSSTLDKKNNIHPA